MTRFCVGDRVVKDAVALRPSGFAGWGAGVVAAVPDGWFRMTEPGAAGGDVPPCRYSRPRSTVTDAGHQPGGSTWPIVA